LLPFTLFCFVSVPQTMTEKTTSSTSFQAYARLETRNQSLQMIARFSENIRWMVAIVPLSTGKKTAPSQLPAKALMWMPAMTPSLHAGKVL
jgi:hypothetical protein